MSTPSARHEILQRAQQCIRGEGLAQHQIGADLRCNRQIVPFGDSPSPRHGDDLHLREGRLEPLDELDPVALDAYLDLYYVPPPLSMFAGIRQLPPGHRLVWQDGAIEIRYDTPEGKGSFWETLRRSGGQAAGQRASR